MKRKEKLLTAIERFPMISECLSRCLCWVCENVEGDLANYDLVQTIEKGDFKRLGKLEDLLIRSRKILGISTDQFCKFFGFTDDLLAADPEKIHDILAEPLLVIDLDQHGFKSIQKLPKSVKSRNRSIPMADFVASRGSLKFAIEVKTVRTESWATPGQLLGNGTRPSWWTEMFRANAITKIEHNNCRALSQLENAKQYYDCDCKLLAIYSRRLGPSTLMERLEYMGELKILKQKFAEIDFFCSKNYFGGVAFYPELPLPK